MFKGVEGKVIAIVRVRGRRNVKPKIRKTLELLKLHRTNHAVVYKATPAVIGMLKVVKDYVTFGEITKEDLTALILKRGEKGRKKAREIYSEEAVKEFVGKFFNGEGRIKDFIDPVFRLHPPRKGWKDIKAHYPKGALGYRDNMSLLLKRMM